MTIRGETVINVWGKGVYLLNRKAFKDNSDSAAQRTGTAILNCMQYS